MIESEFFIPYNNLRIEDIEIVEKYLKNLIRQIYLICNKENYPVTAKIHNIKEIIEIINVQSRDNILEMKDKDIIMKRMINDSFGKFYLLPTERNVYVENNID